MTAAVSIEIPEELYKRIEQVAFRSGQSFETALLEGVSLLYTSFRLADTKAMLQTMDNFSDVQLWAVIYQRFTPYSEQRFNFLTPRAKQGQLSHEEEAELDELIKLYDYQVLLRSKALLLLKQRGYDIDTYLNSTEQE